MQIVVKVNKKAAELSSAAKYFMERETRFELATRGLGKLRGKACNTAFCKGLSGFIA